VFFKSPYGQNQTVNMFQTEPGRLNREIVESIAGKDGMEAGKRWEKFAETGRRRLDGFKALLRESKEKGTDARAKKQPERKD
jgi:hypothetical protein